MATTNPSPATHKADLTRTALRLSAAMWVVTTLAAVYAFSVSRPNNSTLGLRGSYFLFAFAGLSLVSLLLSRAGRPHWGIRLLIIALLVLMPAISTLIAGAGVVLGLATLTMTTAMAALTPGPRQMRWTIMAGFIAGASALLIDLYWPINRLDLPPPLQPFVLPLAALVIVALYGFFIARQFRRFTLQTKLIVAFAGVAIVPLGVLAYLNNLVVERSLTQAANIALSTAARQTASALDALFLETASVVRTEASHILLREYLSLPPEQRADSEADLKTLLDIFVQKNVPRDVHIKSYLLLDRTGKVVGATSPRDLGQDRSNFEYFTAAFTSTTTYLSPLDFSDRTGRGSVFFSHAVHALSSEPIGVLVAQYHFNLQQAVAEKNNLAGPQSYALLLDENHIRLAHGTHPELIYQPIAPLPRARLDELWAANRLPFAPEYVASTNLPNPEQHLAPAVEHAQPAEAPPYTFTAQNTALGTADQVAVAKMTTRPWLVLFVQPQKVFLAPVTEQTRNTVLVGVLIIGLVSLMAISLSQYLTGPITRLTSVATRVSAGDLNARAIVESKDEIGRLAQTFNRMTAQLQQMLTELEARVTERTGQLQAAADISRAATAIRDLDELLRLALELIRERFGFYHASIFLMDEAGEFAVLRESTGEIGAQLKARGHRLGVGSHSLVGWVTQNRRYRVAMDVAGDPFHYKNPLLPDTRSELCIPLMVGDELLGVLDVQSTELNAFDDNRVRVLQTLADQLSVAIQNADLFQRTQASLKEVSELYQQVTSTAWRSLLRNEPRELVFDLEPGARSGHSGGAPLILPLRLGGEVLGAIELHGWRTTAIGPDEQGILDTLATQISVALESAALFQDTQRRRNREQLINDITYRMRATLDPTAIVQSGIRELGKALGATEVVVKLTPTPSSQAGLEQEDRT